MLESLRMFPATRQKKPTLSLAILTCCAFVEERTFHADISMPLTSLYLKNKKLEVSP